MKILCAATYYHPHISGLTVVAKALAEGLAARGHTVTVLASRHSKELPDREIIAGVNVVRVSAAGRVSKGPVMPGYLPQALRLIRQHDVALVHLPATPVEMMTFSAPVRWFRSIPTAVAYHCDLALPPGLWHCLVNAVVASGSYWMMRSAARIVTGSRDYGSHSRMLRAFSAKSIVIGPPVVMPEPCNEKANLLRRTLSPNGEVLIGFAGRWAAEKGLEYLLGALPVIRRTLPAIKVVCAGEWAAVGEEDYGNSLRAALAAHGEAWEVLGPQSPQGMADFYRACDATVLPSINATESFGLVQVESMLCGTPVIASDLPGVRIPVLTAGMGRLAAPRNSQQLADAIVDVVRDRVRYVRPRHEIARHFSSDTAVDRYEDLLLSLAGKKRVQHSGPEVIAKAQPESRSLEAADSSRPDVVLRRCLEILPPFHALVRGIEHCLLRSHAPFAAPLLDLGCGDGTFAALLCRPKWTVGIDSDYTRCRDAVRWKAHCHVINSDAAVLALRGGYFRTVVANCVIEHIPDVDGVLREVRRVLHPNGLFYFGVPSHRFGEMLLFPTVARRLGLERLGHAYADWFNRHSIHFHLDPPEVWIERLETHGFQVCSWKYYGTAAGMRVFDMAHYLSLPHLLSRKLTGRWVSAHLRPAIPVFQKWLQPHIGASPEGDGPYIFFSAQKKGAPMDRREPHE